MKKNIKSARIPRCFVLFYRSSEVILLWRRRKLLLITSWSSNILNLLLSFISIWNLRDIDINILINISFQVLGVYAFITWSITYLFFLHVQFSHVIILLFVIQFFFLDLDYMEFRMFGLEIQEFSATTQQAKTCSKGVMIQAWKVVE